MANLVNEQELFFTAFEPKTANRYIMSIDGIPSYLIKKADRPKITQEKIYWEKRGVDPEYIYELAEEGWEEMV